MTSKAIASTDCATRANKTGYYRLTNALPNELIFHQENTGFEPATYRLIEFAVSIPKLVAEEVFETSNPAYEAFIYPDSPR